MQTPASFITYLIQGNYPRYGDGTSCIADIYIDFGIVGLIFFFTLFGSYTRRMEIALFDRFDKSSLLLLIISISYFALGITIGRKSMFDPLITMARITIFIYLNSLISGTKFKNSMRN
jgi:hypothetical protein